MASSSTATHVSRWGSTRRGEVVVDVVERVHARRDGGHRGLAGAPVEVGDRPAPPSWSARRISITTSSQPTARSVMRPMAPARKWSQPSTTSIVASGQRRQRAPRPRRAGRTGRGRARARGSGSGCGGRSTSRPAGRRAPGPPARRPRCGRRPPIPTSSRRGAAGRRRPRLGARRRSSASASAAVGDVGSRRSSRSAATPAAARPSASATTSGWWRSPPMPGWGCSTTAAAVGAPSAGRCRSRPESSPMERDRIVGSMAKTRRTARSSRSRC